MTKSTQSSSFSQTGACLLKDKRILRINDPERYTHPPTAVAISHNPSKSHKGDLYEIRDRIPWGIQENTSVITAGAQKERLIAVSPIVTTKLLMFRSAFIGGWPGLNRMEFVDMESVREYHFSNSREGERRRVPRVPVFGTWVLGWSFSSLLHGKTPGHPLERWKKKEPTCKTGTWDTRPLTSRSSCGADSELKCGEKEKSKPAPLKATRVRHPNSS